MSRTIIFLLAMVCWLPLASAEVLTVGPGGEYSEIQDAVAAASDGDVLLIAAGDYDPVTIDGIGLHLTADHQAVSITEGIVVQNLPETSSVVIQGMAISNPSLRTVYEYATVRLLNNDGSIRIENCTLNGHDGFGEFDWFEGYWLDYPAQNAAEVDNCLDVAFTRCTITGGEGDSPSDLGSMNLDGESGHHGIAAESSCVTLYDCELVGGNGGACGSQAYWGGYGGDGLWISSNSTVFASGSFFSGGDGGWGRYYGGTGGDGIHHYSTDSATTLLDNVYTGGEAGTGIYPGGPGSGVAGSVTYLSGSARSFQVSSPARVSQNTTLDFEGQADDLVGILISLDHDTTYFEDFKGQLLMSVVPTPILYVFTVIPAGGSLSIPVTMPTPGPGFIENTLFIQSIFSSRSEGLVLGSMTSVILLSNLY